MRYFASGSAIILLASVLASHAFGEDTPGVSTAEIRIGHTNALSGPAAQYGLLARADAAYFKKVNDDGGVNGRKISFIIADDEYNPAKSVEAMRKLVEQDDVLLMFGSFGTPTNSAQAPYLNKHRIPQLFVGSGADKWGDAKELPWSMGYQPSYRTEARIYTKHILQERPNAKIGILYQNDDFGKDYLKGVQDILGDAKASSLIKMVSYETADSTVDSQIVSLKGAGVDTLVLATIPKFGAQALRQILALDWNPTVYVALGAAGISMTTEPVKGKSELTLISGAFAKQVSDPAWANDQGVAQYLEFMKKYMPGVDVNEPLSAYGFDTSTLMTEVLRHAGNDLSRANVMHQAESLKNVELPLLLPGITINTSASDHQPIKQLNLIRWNGEKWLPMGGLISGSK